MNKPIGYHPITTSILERYLITENRKIREHKRLIRGKDPNRLHESLIQEINELRCFSCEGPIIAGVNVTICTRKARVKMYHEACALEKNIEPKMQDIKYPLVQV